jgi:hypothetical protein
MTIRLKPSALRETSPREYAIRFALGGAATVVAGLIAAGFGPVVGGLFLAFPAIFPASATLIERHVRERREKEGTGFDGSLRGRKAAARDAVGAMLGSFGLAAFAAVVWLTIGRYRALALLPSTAAWIAVAFAAWRFRKRFWRRSAREKSISGGARNKRGPDGRRGQPGYAAAFQAPERRLVKRRHLSREHKSADPSLESPVAVSRPSGQRISQGSPNRSGCDAKRQGAHRRAQAASNLADHSEGGRHE